MPPTPLETPIDGARTSDDEAGLLTPRVARGALWIMASRLSGRVFDLLKALILARLLTPRDFGLFGIVMLALATLDTFSQTGINAALIQRRGNIRPYLGTAWTVQGLRGIVLAILLYLAAPAVALFFREPDVADLLRFVSVILVMQGLVNTGIVFFTRDLDFKRAFVFEVTSGGLSLAAGIVLAYQLRSPWARRGPISSGPPRESCSPSCSPRFVRGPELRKDRAGELFAFGRWMSGYAIASWVWQNVDRLVLGRVIGPAPLGVDQMAQRIASMPVSEVAIASMGAHAAGVFQRCKGPGRLGRSFLDVFETVMSFVAPMAVFLAVAAPEVVHGLLGNQWASAIRPLQIVSAAALFTALDIVATPLLVAVGQPRVESWKNCARSAVVMATVLPLTTRYGVEGACASFLLGLADAPPLLGARRPDCARRLGTVARANGAGRCHGRRGLRSRAGDESDVRGAGCGCAHRGRDCGREFVADGRLPLEVPGGPRHLPAHHQAEGGHPGNHVRTLGAGVRQCRRPESKPSPPSRSSAIAPGRAMHGTRGSYRARHGDTSPERSPASAELAGKSECPAR